jgi:hypothetical protein
MAAILAILKILANLVGLVTTRKDSKKEIKRYEAKRTLDNYLDKYHPAAGKSGLHKD